MYCKKFKFLIHITLKRPVIAQEKDHIQMDSDCTLTHLLLYQIELICYLVTVFHPSQNGKNRQIQNSDTK